MFLTKAGVHQKPAEDFFPMTDSTKGGRSSSPPVGMALRFLWEKIKTKLLQQTLRCRERWVTWRFFSFRFAIKDRWFLDVLASAFSHENSQGWIMVRLVEDPLNSYYYKSWKRHCTGGHSLDVTWRLDGKLAFEDAKNSIHGNWCRGYRGWKTSHINHRSFRVCILG